jgi:hypothetical protein
MPATSTLNFSTDIDLVHATNTLKFVQGGSDRFSVSGDVGVLGSTDFFIPQGRKLLLDGAGGHTYIEEESDSNLKFYVAGTEQLNITNGGSYFTNHLSVAATKRLYLDGGTNTYITEASGDTLNFVTGANVQLSVNNSHTTISGILQGGNVFAKSVYAGGSNTSNGFLIETNMSTSNYAMLHGTIKLEQFNFSTFQTIEFSVTTNSDGTIISKAGKASTSITITLFNYNSKWYVWVPQPSSYTTCTAFIGLAYSYQGQEESFNEVEVITHAAVPGSGVSNSTDLVCSDAVVSSAFSAQNATFAGDIDAGAAGKLEFNSNSGNAELIVKNNTATSNTAGTATLQFKQALNSTGGKIVSGRDSNYADGASRDSHLKFYTSTDASDTLVLTLDSNNLATFAGGVTIAGDLNVTGDTITTNTTTITVKDPIIAMANNNAADAVDIGLYGKYVESATVKYTGMIRDASEDTNSWIFFDGLTAEPGTTVDTSNAGFDYADIRAGLIRSADGFIGNLTGNVTGNTSGTAATVTGAAQSSITSLGTLSALTVAGRISTTRAPGANNTDPTIAFGDGNTGFYERSDNDLRVSVGGVNYWEFSANCMGNVSEGKAHFNSETATATNPSIIPWRNDADTGIGRSSANVLSLIAGGTEALSLSATAATFAGTINHTGLVPSSGTGVDQLTTVNMTFQLSANTWTDTGINGGELASGTYAMQCYVEDFNAGGLHYYEYYSATMSWYGSGTNSTNYDEIVTHVAGHANNTSHLQFRTLRHASGGDNLMLQVKQSFAHSAALDSSDGKTMTFKFRRLI